MNYVNLIVPPIEKVTFPEPVEGSGAMCCYVFLYKCHKARPDRNSVNSIQMQ